MVEECVVKISKSGRNLFARIPDEDMDKINRGDTVKVIVLEKASKNLGEKQLKKLVKEFLDKPCNGEKLKGTIMGFSVEMPLVKILNSMTKIKAEKLLMEVLSK